MCGCNGRARVLTGTDAAPCADTAGDVTRCNSGTDHVGWCLDDAVHCRRHIGGLWNIARARRPLEPRGAPDLAECRGHSRRRPHAEEHAALGNNAFARWQKRFEQGFAEGRERYRNLLALTMTRRRRFVFDEGVAFDTSLVRSSDYRFYLGLTTKLS